MASKVDTIKTAYGELPASLLNSWYRWQPRAVPSMYYLKDLQVPKGYELNPLKLAGLTTGVSGLMGPAYMERIYPGLLEALWNLSLRKQTPQSSSAAPMIV